MMSEHRTKAERAMDSLVAEVRRLEQMHHPGPEQLKRLRHIKAVALPKAWRAINQAREVN